MIKRYILENWTGMDWDICVFVSGNIQKQNLFNRFWKASQVIMEVTLARNKVTQESAAKLFSFLCLTQLHFLTDLSNREAFIWVWYIMEEKKGSRHWEKKNLQTEILRLRSFKKILNVKTFLSFMLFLRRENTSSLSSSKRKKKTFRCMFVFQFTLWLHIYSFNLCSELVWR